MVRLGDPLQPAGRAGITHAATTGVAGDPRRRPASTGGLDIDERALRRGRRHRPVTLADDPPPEPTPGPNWVLRIALILVGLLGLAIAYQFLLRPLLKS
ncbi:MAG TPA: hypothetical protein RMH99_05270 [Sandaracinaceae bacterium LLY-WYZ-13_1]|nr:hypothetical protein [Sandaracinaceae bacterium LLY-WYZ-13_1]